MLQAQRIADAKTPGALAMTLDQLLVQGEAVVDAIGKLARENFELFVVKTRASVKRAARESRRLARPIGTALIGRPKPPLWTTRHGAVLPSDSACTTCCASLDNLQARAHHVGMPSNRLAEALKLAAELPDEERAELARELIRSLPESFDDFDSEIERRLDEVDSGTAKLIPWEQARELIHRDE